MRPTLMRDRLRPFRAGVHTVEVVAELPGTIDAPQCSVGCALGSSVGCRIGIIAGDGPVDTGVHPRPIEARIDASEARAIDEERTSRERGASDDENGGALGRLPHCSIVQAQPT